MLRGSQNWGKKNKGVPSWLSRLRIQPITAVALIIAVVQVQSLARELSQVTGATKPNQTKQKKNISRKK